MMKNGRKKLTGVLLALAMFTASTGMVLAEEIPPIQPGVDVIEFSMEDAVQPRMDAFKFLYASVLCEGTTATCTITASLRDGYTFSYSMELQRTKTPDDEASWKKVKSWTGSGSGSYAKGQTATASSGYYYRTKIVASGKSDGEIIEIITVYSSEQDYT